MLIIILGWETKQFSMVSFAAKSCERRVVYDVTLLYRLNPCGDAMSLICQSKYNFPYPSCENMAVLL